MFDTMCAGLDEPALIAAIEQASREEASAAARKLAAMAELIHSTVTYDEERDTWAYDSWADAAAHVGAALTMSTQRASAQMRIAIALRDRLPRVGALFVQGRISARLVSEMTWRTRLITEPILGALVDAALAQKAQSWGPLSDERLEGAIDAVINRYDPDAVSRVTEILKTRDFKIGAHDDPNALVSIWAKLLASDAAVLEARITAMVSRLCDKDPRTVGEQRCDAGGAFIRGDDYLPCRCGSPTCTAPATAPKSNVVISVIADPAAITAAQDLIATQDRQQQDENADEDRAEEAPEPAPCLKDSGLALLPGAKVLPLVALAEAIRGGATIKDLWLPGPEPHYHPSAKLAAFIRARDMFCRFPGCNVPAARCDIDHVVPYPYGPTHPSNMHCKCRTHHLAKTFWQGWRDVQFPDGTVVWTTPYGQTYTTTPGSRLFFPSWNVTTAELPPMAQPPPGAYRDEKMPKRQRTRAADTATRIKTERAQNNTIRHAQASQRAATQKTRRPPPTKPPPDCSDDPPPF